MSLLANTFICLSFIVAWCSVFVALPAMQRTRVRSKLWSLRDELVDDIRDDRLAGSPKQARLLYQEIEIALRYAPAMTMGKLIVFAVICRNVEPPEMERVDLESVHDPIERELLEQRIKMFHETLVGYLFIGGPVGIIATAIGFTLFGPVAAPYALWRVIRRRSAHAGAEWLARLRNTTTERISEEQMSLGPAMAARAQTAVLIR